jgi:hypothetical protein
MMAKAFIGASLFAVVLAGMSIAPAVSAASSEGGFVVPGSKAASLSSCVRPTEFMRRKHMELILHQRDVTVHEGIRATKDSLAGCVACHVSYDEKQQPVPVYAEGQFCHTCHELAAVDLTCFGCHATVPAHTDAEAKEEIRRQQAEQSHDLNASPAAASPAWGIDVAGVQDNGSPGVGD